MGINIFCVNHPLFEQPPFNKILSQIRYGEKNGIFMKDHAERVNLSERDLRKSIEHIRRSGIVILSGKAGYYFPSNKSELINILNELHVQPKAHLIR